MAVDFNYFLAQKYALLRQQADADTTNAGSQRIQANANAEVAGTTAALNRTQNQLAPADSAARNAAQLAGARLANEQAAVVAPESTARIAQIGAETALTGSQNKALIRTALTPFSQVIGGGSPLGRIFGPGGYQGFQLSPRLATADTRARRAGETEAAYLDRINGL